MTNVTLDDARAACAAHGMRLCTAAEWERACRGSASAGFPYGPEYVPGRCNVRGGARPAITPAGAFPGCVSPAGIYDMSGNAAEWVQEGSARGGSAGDGSEGGCARAQAYGPTGTAVDVGYRCCATPGAF